MRRRAGSEGRSGRTVPGRLEPGWMLGLLAAFVLAGGPASAQSGNAGAGVPDEAAVRTALENRIAARPSEPLPYLELARFELRSEDAVRAESILRTGLTEAGATGRSYLLRVALVEVLALQGRWTDAAMELSLLDPDVHDLDPAFLRTGAQVQVNAGLEAWAVGDADAAAEGFRRATALDPGVRAAWVERARVRLVRQDLDRARAILDTALVHHPGDAELRLLRASTLPPREAGAPTVAALRDLRAQRPGDTGVALSLAGYLAGTGDLPGALALQDTLVRQPDAPPEVFSHVGGFWLENQAADTARALLERGLAAHPDDAGLHALMGATWTLVASRDAAADSADLRAARAYLRAADRVEDGTWLRIRAAGVLAGTGRANAVVEALEPLSREGVPLMAALAATDLLLAEDRPEAAQWILRRAALASPAHPRLQESEARVRLALGDTASARSTLLELAAQGSPTAVQRLGPDVSGETLRAAIRGGLERLAQGERQMASNRPADPGDPATLLSGSDLQEAWVRDRIEEDRQAVRSLLEGAVFGTGWGPAELARLRDIYPGSVLLARLDTRLALRQGRLDRARSEVDRLLRLQPREAELHGLRGEILEARGEEEAALDSWGRALEIDADAPGAFQALVRLHRASGTLETLLQRVRRLRSIEPDNPQRREQEVELLHRLGRPDEARAVAEEGRGGGSGRGAAMPAQGAGGRA